MAPSIKRGRTPWHVRLWCAESLAALAAITCFCNTLPNDFCFDDSTIVRDSVKVNEPDQWAEVWTTDHWSVGQSDVSDRDLLYRPVSLSTHRLVRIVAGIDPLAQHCINVLLHALISVMVVRLCRHLGGGHRTAAIAGVLFAVLPIHTEAVAPVVGRSDLLATLGVLVAVLAHRRSLMSDSSGPIVGWRITAGLAAFAALGSKESGLAVVILVPLFDLLWCRRGNPTDRLGRSRRQMPWRASYLLVALAVYLALRSYALGGGLYQTPPLTKTVNVLVDAPSWQRALGAVQLWGMYWAKTFWPSVLSIKYTINSLRLATGPADPHVVLGALVCVALTAASVLSAKRGKYGVTVLALAIAVSYAPTANVFVLMRVFIAERIWYLPSVWLTVLAALFLAPKLIRPVTWIVFGVVAIGMVARCWTRNAEWRNNGVLFAAAAMDQPSGAGALQLYGEWLTEHGQYESGVELLNQAVEIDLGFTDAHRALGRAHLRAGNLPAALEHLRTADMQVSGHRATVAALARVSGELSHRDLELRRLEQALEEEPSNVDAVLALARRLRDLGRVREAVDRMTEHDATFAGDATWQAEFAVTLVYLNERDRAIERYGRSLGIDPDQPQQAVELASLLRERGRVDDIDRAWGLMQHAYSLAPRAPSVLVCRGELLALRGDFAGAGEAFRGAIRGLPEDSPLRRVYGERAKALGLFP